MKASENGHLIVIEVLQTHGAIVNDKGEVCQESL
jgi:hypothetical protein